MKKRLLLALCILFTTACDSPDYKKKKSEGILYFNGDIITMEGEQPEYVEALVAQGGKIVFTGKLKEARENHPSAEQHNLNGSTMLPGFIDAHGHGWITGFQMIWANLLPPPDGKTQSIDDLINTLKTWAAKNQELVEKVGYIIGIGYDDAQLKERRHPLASELDRVSTDVPVFVLHQSYHLGAMNHKALEKEGYTADAPDPKGGVIRRMADGKTPDGVLEESASGNIRNKISNTLDASIADKIGLAGLEVYTRNGFTTMQEGSANPQYMETWQRLAANGQVSIDINVFPFLRKYADMMPAGGLRKNYDNHVRLAGVKLMLDGSPQAKTAWLTLPYEVPPAGQSADYRGYPAFPDEEELVALVDSSFINNWPILAHCNGDAAADQLIKVVKEATDRYGRKDRRTVMIHSQVLRDDQLDQMKELDIIPSFFGIHTYYWGDWHRDEVLGKNRAYRISPAQSAFKKGMIFTEHHDAPVTPPSATLILFAQVNRTSRSGDVIGPDERVSPYIALKSVTQWAAYQYFEEEIKGTLTSGKLADLVILNQNPLKINPAELRDIVVLETIKEGQTVYKK
ncbi:MAG: amidohydrolase [Roseivirga sp.]